MKKCIQILTTASIMTILLLPYSFLFMTHIISSTSQAPPLIDNSYIAQNGVDPIPLSRIAFVESVPGSFIDDFAYMATVPTSVFYHDNNQYLSPILYSSGLMSEDWLIEDWAEYLSDDGGITQAISVGNYDSSELIHLQHEIGTTIFPRITGDTSYDIAARLAVSEWASSDIVVLALAKDSFNEPTVSEGSYSYQFVNEEVRLIQPSATVQSSSPLSIRFSTTASDGWLVGSFNWTSSDVLVHRLFDPNGVVVDYSVYARMYHKRYSPNIQSPLPMQFWVPNVVPGEWNMVVYPTPPLLADIPLDCKVWLHPGFRHNIEVPSNANWLNLSLSWDNAATDINMALVDPTGRMVAWAPTGSTLSQLGGETINFPNPMAGEWTVVVAWMDATTEQNNVDLKWKISTIDPDIQGYMESAANGAVIASLLNSPLLYVSEDSVPEVTQWALDRLGASNIIFVDPMNLHSPSLETSLSTYPIFVNLSNYPAVSAFIKSLSSENDVIITIPMGNGDEFFAPSALAGAFHGAPVFSLCGNNNEMTTRAEETWAPYLIGPEIEVYLVDKFTSRAENGWYDERIPNTFSMTKASSDFDAFLEDRGAYNESVPQSVLIVSPDVPLKVSFDRSLISHYRPGRIPAKNPSSASVMIDRAILHRFLSLTANSADSALLTQYAYTYGYPVADNLNNVHTLYQVDDLATAVESMGLNIESHIGVNEVFESLNNQVSLWLISTHGTLTVLPTDPPKRPDGLGIFSLRDQDAAYGFETTDKRDADGNYLVNPYIYPEERAHHVLTTTDDFMANVGKMGSTIVHITACLLGGSKFPLAMMERGAVGVVASPRTVYFTPAGLLEVVFTDSLVAGNSTGESLRLGLRLTSIDYTNPWPYDPRDYANQHVLYGDPEIHLYNPSTTPHIDAVDPLTSAFGTHTPGNGVPEIAAVGFSNLLPTILSGIGAEFEFFSDSNFSQFVSLLCARKNVIVEPGMSSALINDFLMASDDIQKYITYGGVMVIFGVPSNMSWLPWPLTVSSGSGNSVTFVDPLHPILTTPNTLSSSVAFQGYFSSLWENFTVLAADGSNPVFVTSTIGSGKIALSTINPGSDAINEYLQNAVAWVEQPSIILKSVLLSEVIIWEGDRVTITMELSDLIGNPITEASVSAWLNETEFTVEETSQGVFTVLLPESWTNGHVGVYSLRIHAQKASYDTLTIVLIDFLRIKSSPILIILIVGGIFVTSIVAYAFLKRRRGESIISRGGRAVSAAELQRRRKQDEEIDLREVFED